MGESGRERAASTPLGPTWWVAAVWSGNFARTWGRVTELKCLYTPPSADWATFWGCRDWDGDGNRRTNQGCSIWSYILFKILTLSWATRPLCWNFVSSPLSVNDVIVTYVKCPTLDHGISGENLNSSSIAPKRKTKPVTNSTKAPAASASLCSKTWNQRKEQEDDRGGLSRWSRTTRTL